MLHGIVRPPAFAENSTFASRGRVGSRSLLRLLNRWGWVQVLGRGLSREGNVDVETTLGRRDRRLRLGMARLRSVRGSRIDWGSMGCVELPLCVIGSLVQPCGCGMANRGGPHGLRRGAAVEAGVFFEVLGPLEGTSAPFAQVRLEWHMDAKMAGNVVALGTGDFAVFPFAGEAEVAGGLAAHMVLAQVDKQGLGGSEDLCTALPVAGVKSPGGRLGKAGGREVGGGVGGGQEAKVVGRMEGHGGVELGVRVGVWEGVGLRARHGGDEDERRGDGGGRWEVVVRRQAGVTAAEACRPLIWHGALREEARLSVAWCGRRAGAGGGGAAASAASR